MHQVLSRPPVNSGATMKYHFFSRRTGLHTLAWLAPIALSILTAPWSIVAAQETVFTYQGRIQASGTDFNGVGLFKFALVTSSNANHRATATPIISGQFVVGYNVTSGGSGYVTPPAVVISGGGGSGATAH